MSRERYTTNYTANTQRSPLALRAVAGVLVLCSLALIFMARSQHPLIPKLNAALLDITTPVVEWVTAPISGARSFIHDKKNLLNAFEENKKLRTENDVLRRWQSVAQTLKAENDALRSLAGYHPVETARYVTARVVGQGTGGYGSTLLLNIGTADGIRELQPVIDAYGMIGRVTNVGEHSARVLLISDALSRIPVVSASARVHAILAGTGDELMQLTFLGDVPTSVAVGEQIVTTEEGGLIPGGIVIGTVFRRDAKGLAVKPLRPLTQNEYVRVVVVE